MWTTRLILKSSQVVRYAYSYVEKRKNPCKMAKWLEDPMLKFLQEYIQHECFWDIWSTNYKNKELQESCEQLMILVKKKLFRKLKTSDHLTRKEKKWMILRNQVLAYSKIHYKCSRLLIIRSSVLTERVN